MACDMAMRQHRYFFPRLAVLLDAFSLLRPATRAHEVASLRLRLMAEASPRQVDPQERRLALRLRDMRTQMIGLIGDVRACRSCARGYPLPHGRWEGGYCCGGTTENVFQQEELACLRASGTRPRDFRTPRAVHAGCAFRGPRGCSLAPAHRPNLCVRYTCRDLHEEFSKRGIERQVRQLASQIQRTFSEYRSLRSNRLDRESLERFEAETKKISGKRMNS